MKKKIILVCSFSILLNMQALEALGTMVTPQTTNPIQPSQPSSPQSPTSQVQQQSQTHEAQARNLGKNRLAQIVAWLSLVSSTALGTFLSYKAIEQLCDQLFVQLPLLKIYHQSTAAIVSGIVVAPLSLVSLVKCGPLGWYFFYMLYAGERVSPLLAQNALHDLSIYVNHLKTVKAVQAELLAVIAQINQELDASQNAQSKRTIVDPTLVDQLNQAIADNEAYVQQVITALHAFLSDEEINQALQQNDLQLASKGDTDFSITTDLQDNVHAIAQNLQTPGIDLGYDAVGLNQLIQDLISYWQQYTIGLAEGIDNSLQFCHTVYDMEQIVINWFDRALFSA